MKSEDKLTWRGKPLEECSKEELIQAVYDCHAMVLNERKSKEDWKDLCGDLRRVK